MFCSRSPPREAIKVAALGLGKFSKIRLSESEAVYYAKPLLHAAGSLSTYDAVSHLRRPSSHRTELSGLSAQEDNEENQHAFFLKYPDPRVFL